MDRKEEGMKERKKGRKEGRKKKKERKNPNPGRLTSGPKLLPIVMLACPTLDRRGPQETKVCSGGCLKPLLLLTSQNSSVALATISA